LLSTPIRIGLQISCAAFLALPSPAPTQTAGQPTTPPQAAPATPTRESLAGEYEGNQMEVAARLLLKPDGKFEYELAYGALDEVAAGTWDVKPGEVSLTTVPAVVPPRFVVESDQPDPAGGLWIKLSSGPVMEGARQRIYLIYDPKEPADMAEVGDDGRVPLPGNRLPTAIIPEIPVYPIMSKPIPLTGTSGHRLTLRFQPNDIGKADFRATRLAIEDGVLVMPRRDLEVVLHFKRQSAH